MWDPIFILTERIFLRERSSCTLSRTFTLTRRYIRTPGYSIPRANQFKGIFHTWDGVVVRVVYLRLLMRLIVIAGRVNCLGTRLAKVEMKTIAALLLLGFEFSTVGADGVPCNPHPRPNWNDVLMCRPDDAELTLRYSRRPLVL